MVTKLDRQLCHVFVSFFGLDRAQRSIVFLPFWTCWRRSFRSFYKTPLTYRWLIWLKSMFLVLSLKLAIMLNWMHLDVLNIVLNLFYFWIVITIVVIIQWSSICLALSRYLLTGQWRVTVRGSDLCTWYSLKNILKIVIKVEWLRSSTDNFVMFLLAFLDLTVHNVQ